MGFDPFNLLLSFIVFIIYGSVCGIAIVFTFFLDIYLKIDEKLRFEFLAPRKLNPLEINIQWFDAWLIRHNKIAGPLLILLSMIDLKLFFNIINSF